MLLEQISFFGGIVLYSDTPSSDTDDGYGIKHGKNVSTSNNATSASKFIPVSSGHFDGSRFRLQSHQSRGACTCCCDMAHSKFSLDGPAFEHSTRQVIQPNHVMLLQEEEEVMEAGVDTQLLQTPPGLPAPQEEQGEQEVDAPENPVLKCMMEVACDRFHAFQEFEHYSLGVNSGSDCDVPEDELTDEMEDVFSDEDQLVPANLQEEGDPTEGDHDQLSPGNIPVDVTVAIEENIEPSAVNLHGTLVNVQVTEPEDPSLPRHLDEMEDIVAIEEGQLVPVNPQEAEHFTERHHDQSSPVIIPVEDLCSEEDLVNVEEEEDPTFQGDHDQLSLGSIPLEDITSTEEDQLVPVNSQEEEDPTGGDHDQLSPGSIPLEDITAIEEDQLDPVNMLEQEDFTVQGDHDQPSPVIVPVEDIIGIEGNETSPLNLHLTVVNVQVTKPEDPSTPRHLDLSIATFDGVYAEADQEVIPKNQLDVKVQTVATTSAAEGESSSSNLILMDIHVDRKPPESEDSYELLHEAVKGDSTDLKDVFETPLKRVVETGAPET